MEALKELCSFKESYSISNIQDLLNVLRQLRNLVTTIDILDQNEGLNTIMENTMALLIYLKKEVSQSGKDDDFNLSLRVGCQFISNLCSRNDVITQLIWTSHKSTLISIFKEGDSKLRNCISLIFINCLKISQEEFCVEALADKEFLNLICTEASIDDQGCVQFFLEKLLNACQLDNIYSNLKFENICFVMDLLAENLGSGNMELTESEVNFLLLKFKEMSQAIMNNRGEVSPNVFSRLTSVICSLSSDEKYLHVLQKDMSFAIDSVYSLKALHGSEKEAANVKSSSLKPAIDNYKGSLIRIIGNLAWNNSEIQNLVRENSCIEIFLECCKIDFDNPFVKEWSIFAIRNFCKDNLENQKFIASLESKGFVHSILNKEINAA